METFVRRYTVFSKTDIRIEKNSFFFSFQMCHRPSFPILFYFSIAAAVCYSTSPYTFVGKKKKRAGKEVSLRWGEKTYPLPLCTPWILNPCQKLRSPSDRGIFLFFPFFHSFRFPAQDKSEVARKRRRALLGRNCYTAYHVMLLPRVFFLKKRKKKK